MIRRLGVSRSIAIEDAIGPHSEEVMSDVRHGLAHALGMDLQKHHGVEMGTHTDDVNSLVTVTLKTHAFSYEEQVAVRRFLSAAQRLEGKSESESGVQSSEWADIAMKLLAAFSYKMRFEEDS